MDFPSVGFVADHAYWLSGLTCATASGDRAAGTDRRALARLRRRRPAPRRTQHGGGTLTGGSLPALAYTEQSKAWGATPKEPTADVLDIDAKNVGAVTIDPARARVDCEAQLIVKSDGPVTVTLAGCGRKASLGGKNGRCDASQTPRASVSRGSQVARRRLSLRGRAVAFRCVGGRAVRGKVRRVYVSVSRRAGGLGQCRFLGGRGRLTAARSCARPVLLRARLGRFRPGKVPWTFSSKPHLARGRYTVSVRAVDARGKAGGVRGRFNKKTFVVR